MIDNSSTIQRWLWSALASPVAWLGLSVVCAVVDFASGPDIQFPIAYVLPVGLAAWHGALRSAVGLAVLLPLVRLLFTVAWDRPSPSTNIVNAAIRVGVFGLIAVLTYRSGRELRSLRRIAAMERMLGLCGVCRRIHDAREDSWQPLEDYVTTHAHELTRQICPACQGTADETFDRR